MQSRAEGGADGATAPAWAETMGRLGGRSQKNLRWGDGSCIRPPNIWRSSVMRCAGKYEVTKNR